VRCHFLPCKRAGQHITCPAHISSSFPYPSASSTPDSTNTASLAPFDSQAHKLTTSCAERRFTPITTSTTTRALAQDDNSEPRRSLYQVLTAQRSSPTVLFDFACVLLLFSSPSCSSATMFSFAVIFSYRHAATLALRLQDNRGYHWTNSRILCSPQRNPHRPLSFLFSRGSSMLFFRIFQLRIRRISHTAHAVLVESTLDVSVRRVRSFKFELSKSR
jgi:hypothetical protein